ncbi:uncharacterized protein LOC113083014 [Carassius auratus]|uniref:Uncharacterized protein LOC113083014 n=1 Tax=Carassius auratus TaxID=7957 RepID=A0A6P6NM57_CARAU|nr:uncharacterized protein LOC113083014 [Carassius auratus]
MTTMSEYMGKGSLSEMSLSKKQSVISGSHVSVKSDQSKDGDLPVFSKNTFIKRSALHVTSFISMKSDCSKCNMPNSLEEIPPSTKRLKYEAFDSDFQNHRNQKHFADNLQWIFQDLLCKISTFLKNELNMFKKILQKENTQYFVKEFNENRCSVKEAALDLTLYFLREMKQDETADTLKGKRFTNSDAWIMVISTDADNVCIVQAL